MSRVLTACALIGFTIASGAFACGADTGLVSDGSADAGTGADVSADPTSEFTCSSPRLAQEGLPCDLTTPCGPSLDCIFGPGCDPPKGTCERWARCPDVPMLYTICDCDGVFHNGGYMGPYRNLGQCEGGVVD